MNTRPGRPTARSRTLGAPGAHFRPAAMLSFLVLLACQAPRELSIVIPAGGEHYFTFRRGEVLCSRPGLVPVTPPADAGAARAWCIDHESGWSAIAFEHHVAFLLLSDGSLRYVPAPFPLEEASVALHQNVVLVRSGTRLAWLSVPEGRILAQSEAEGWLSLSGWDRLHLAQPLSDGEFLLLGSDPGGLLSMARAGVQRVDRSGGDWRIAADQELRGMTYVQRCVSRDGRLYAAGIDERADLEPGRGGTLEQSLVILQVDPATLQQRELVYQPLTGKRPVVRDLAVGARWVGVVVSPGEVRVWEILDQGRASAEVLRQTYAEIDSIAWLTDDQLLVQTPGGVQVLRVQR